MSEKVSNGKEKLEGTYQGSSASLSASLTNV